MSNQSCERCKHFAASSVDSDLGDCRFWPPRVVRVEKRGKGFQVASQFPIVRKTSWCGRFRKVKGDS